MLTIKKHPLSSKAAILGTAAFLVGFTGAGAYIERVSQHENLAFDREATVLGISDSRSAEQGSSANDTQDTKPPQATSSPQVANGSLEILPTTTGSGSVSAQPVTPAIGAAPTTPTTPTPGRGGGTQATESIAPTPSTPDVTGVLDTLQNSCLINNCVITTVEEAADNLLGL